MGGKTGETLSSPTVSTRLQRIAAQARQHPAMPFLTLAHLIDVELLREAYGLVQVQKGELAAEEAGPADWAP